MPGTDLTPHTATYRVYYEDTDAGGVVYYANYLKFAERARTDALRDIGISQSELFREQGLLFVVSRVEIDYKRPARLEDEINVQTRLHQIGKARIKLAQRICKDKTLLAEMVVELALIGPESRAIRIPENLASELRRAFAG